MNIFKTLVEFLNNELLVEYWVSGYSSQDGEEEILMSTKAEPIAKFLKLVEEHNYCMHHPDAYYKAYWGGERVWECNYQSNDGRDIYAFHRDGDLPF